MTGNKIAIGLCPVCVHGKTGGLPDLTDAELAARFALLEGLEPPVQEIDIWVDYMHEIPDNYLPFLQTTWRLNSAGSDAGTLVNCSGGMPMNPM